jgi:hypothetical protein
MCTINLYLLGFVTKKKKKTFEWFEMRCENITLIKQVGKN